MSPLTTTSRRQRSQTLLSRMCENFRNYYARAFRIQNTERAGKIHQKPPGSAFRRRNSSFALRRVPLPLHIDKKLFETAILGKEKYDRNIQDQKGFDQRQGECSFWYGFHAVTPKTKRCLIIPEEAEKSTLKAGFFRTLRAPFLWRRRVPPRGGRSSRRNGR